MSEARADLPPPDGRALVSGLGVPTSPLLDVGNTPFRYQPSPQPTPPVPQSPSSVVDFWLSKGVPLHVAQGIQDQTMKESGGDPMIVGDGGTSLGLYQHHGSRMRDLVARVENEQAFKEVTGGDPIAAAHWDEIKNAKTRQEASSLWQKYFERPAGSSVDAAAGQARTDVQRLQQQYDSNAGRLHGEAAEIIKEIGKGNVSLEESMKRVRAAQDKSDEANEAALKAISGAPQQPDLDGVKNFGGVATMIGLLGGLFTRRPMTASLNAAGAAMEAYNQKDMQRYKIAYDSWKNNTELMFKIADMNRQRVHDILSDEKLGLDERRANVDVMLRAVGLERLADEARVAGLERIYDWDKDYAKMVEQGEHWKMQLEATNNRILASHADEQLLQQFRQEFRETNQREPNFQETRDAYQSIQQSKKTTNPQTLALQKYLEEHPEASAQEIQTFLASGRTSRSGPAAAVNKFLQENPNATADDVTKFLGKVAAETSGARAVTSGPAGNAIRSFSVSISHVATLEELGEALNNGNINAINAAKNRLATEFGDPDPTNFDAARRIVGAEISKAIIGGAGTGEERKTLEDDFQLARSFPQLTGVIKTLKKLIAGQLDGYRRQFQDILTEEEFNRKLSPEAIKEIGSLRSSTTTRSSYTSPNDVYKAYDDGRLSKEEAKKILIDKFGRTE